MKTAGKFLVMVITVFLMTSCASGQSKFKFTVLGRLDVEGAIYQDHDPKVGAKVVLSSSTDSRFEKMVITDGEGHFTASEVPLGEVQILVYDSNDQLVAEGVGELILDGDTLNVFLEAVTAEN